VFEGEHGQYRNRLQGGLIPFSEKSGWAFFSAGTIAEKAALDSLRRDQI
jgi:hypothetical protein